MLNKLLLTAATIASLASGLSQAGQLGVYQSDQNGFDTRTYWYDDGKEITVFDTQFTPALTDAMVKEIRKTSQHPITRVVVTHPNPDKFNGLSVLHGLGATSIASKATADAMSGVNDYKRYYWISMAKAFTDETYPRFESVKQTFTGKTTIKLASGETITLTELKNPGVSSTQTVARIDATGDLIVGDLAHPKAHYWLEGGIVEGKPRANMQNWAAALDELRSLNGTRIHGGRGESAPLPQAIDSEKAYLKSMDKLVADYISKLGAKKTELADSSTAASHYAAIQKQAEQQFPERKLSYLIGYGVYGLVNSKR